MKSQKTIREIITSLNRQPILFIGSGFSKRYLGLENWEELLKKFISDISNDDFKYEMYANKISEEDYYGKQAAIAKLLEKDYNEAVFNDQKFNDFKIRNKNFIKKGISPFKIAIAEYFENIDYNNTEEKEEINLLKEIQQRNISGIITTNYDKFLEKIFQNFKVFAGQEELIFSNLEGIAEIYKIHGTSSSPETIIITSDDYKKFEEKSDYLTAKLLTIFLEYPIIFIGYSINDKNIKNIFSSIAKCLNQEQLEKLKQRLIFIEYKKLENSSVDTHSIDFNNGKIIEMIKIKTDNFSEIYKSLKEIKAKYSPRVIRDLRNEIYKLAEDSNPNSLVVATGFENLNKLDDTKLYTIGIGVKEDGYGIPVTAEKIYEDIILDNGYFMPDLIVSYYLPTLLKTNSGGLPIYKYLKDYKGNISENIKNEIAKRTELNLFLNKQQNDLKENYRNTLTEKTVNYIISREGNKEAYKKIYFLEKEEINLNDLENYLKSIIIQKLVNIKNNSELKRLIRIYDFLKFRK
ncbi:SIR2 family protein [Fusobacterium simiae]|nr:MULTISPECIES: SIR2 family protein [Fusobacterium]MDC7956286.1 SIR2 family protein [Fusobacterium simiae]